MQNGTEGAQGKAQHHTHQQQRSGAVYPGGGRHDEQSGEKGSRKGGRHQRGATGKGRCPARGQRRYGGPQTGPSRHAHDVRIGQGIAEEGLHLRPAEGQGGSGGKGREHAGQAQFPENGSGGP